MPRPAGTLGSIRGTPGGKARVLPRLPPPELPATPRMPRARSNTHQAQVLLTAYLMSVGRAKVAIKGVYLPRLAAAAAELRVAGVVDHEYVRYVVRKHKQRKGTEPTLTQVFGKRAVKCWLAEYLRRGATRVRVVPTYRPTAERRLAYRGRTPF